ncbi:MAG TPA: SMP-30/gluconolactonase/LRE family protein [Bryobacteraceae bacterium]|nr:SMP-30/gluconolactonase/LRE family protein [Bryobacteraceae bacterium]
MSRAAFTGLAAGLFCLLTFGQDWSEIKLEQLAKGYAFTEGPAWSKDGYLVFSDTPADRLLKWVPGHAVEVFRENAGGPSGNAFDSEGRLYTCETRARRVTRTDKKGAIEVIAEKWEGKRLNAPNDVVVSKSGHVYFTDPAFGGQADHRELDFYGVYELPPKGAIKLVAKPAGRPNGIALSPNGRILYVVNSDERNVRAYDLDKNGEPANERVLISGIAGVPGGIRVDDKGNLYVTTGGVAIYSPDGKPVHMVTMHGRASNCGFGEADLKTLFVTNGPVVYRLRLETKGAY